MKLGGKPIEFKKGKAGIAAANAEKLAHVINTVMAAVLGGELDQLHAQATKPGPRRKRPDFTGENGGPAFAPVS